MMPEYKAQSFLFTLADETNIELTAVFCVLTGWLLFLDNY